MKKQWLVLFLSIMFAHAVAHRPVQKDERSLSQCFKNYTQKYVVEPSWTIPLFLKMDLSHFEISFKELAFLMKEKPWFLCGVHSKKYSERKQRDLFIEQCAFYDTFLRGLFVNPKNKSMVFAQGKAPGKPYYSIFDYWRSSKNFIGAHFYAFYFDRVAAKYIEAINNAFLNMDDLQEYQTYLKESWNHFVTLSRIYKYLETSSYEARYSEHLKKYGQIRELLTKEKRERGAL